MNSQNDAVLFSLLVTLLGFLAFRVDVTSLNGIETRMQTASTLATLAFVQSVLGGNAVVEHPDRIKKLSKNKIVRFILLFMTSFSVVRDLEYALIISLAYMVTMQLLRTPEERKEYPYMI